MPTNQFQPYSFPPSYHSQDTTCVRVPRALLPALASHLRFLEWAAAWQNDDWQQGRQAALLLQERLLLLPEFDPGDSMLSMGDSWSVGAESVPNWDNQPGYPDWLYAQFIHSYWPSLRYHNTGISGETTETCINNGQLQNAIDFIASEQFAERRVGIITISLGGNDMIDVFPPPIGSLADGNAQLQQVRDNLAYIYEQLQSACDAQIITMTYANLYPGFDFPGFGRLADIWVPKLHQVIREVAAAHGIPVAAVDDLDIYDDALMDSLFFVRRPYAVWDPLNAVQNFDFHPRPAGHSFIARKMLEALIRQRAMLLPSVMFKDIPEEAVAIGIDPVVRLSGTLTRFTQIQLPANQLSGPLPSRIAECTNLVTLGLNVNSLTGPLTPLSTLTKLTTLNIGLNAFTGDLTPLSALTVLNTLYFYNNQLTGDLTPLSALTDLYYLSGAVNQLTGDLTPLSALTKLRILDLHNNQLTGPIPNAIGAFQFIYQILLYNNQISQADLSSFVIAGLWPNRVQLGSRGCYIAIYGNNGLTAEAVDAIEGSGAYSGQGLKQSGCSVVY